MANFPTGVPPTEVVRAYWKLSWPACCNLKGQLPPKTFIFLLHSLAALVSSQPTLCFAHEQPFSVSNAGQPTSVSIGALYTSIGGTPCKNLPLSVVRIYYTTDETKLQIYFFKFLHTSLLTFSLITSI
jgi:hypothetical protein